MRWFYVPNENTEGDQIGPRMAFEKLLQGGVFSAYTAYSYLVRGKAANCHQDALNEFIESAREFAPDVIFIQHPGNGYPMDRLFLQKLKAIPSKPKLVLHEGDPYDKWFKRIDKTLRNTFKEADLVILVGLGKLAELVRDAGAKNIRFIPHSYDSKRFSSEWQPTHSRTHDAVMIANCGYVKNIPGLYLPGGRKRRQTAEALYLALGDRFAVFGGGGAWQGRPYAHGNLPFDRQGEVIRSSWVSVNWHHFDDLSFYSSDRLAISLASGVPHITNYQEGYQHIFEGIPGLFIVKTPREAADAAIFLLSMPILRRNELGQASAEYARTHFEATKVYSDIVEVIKEHLQMR